MSAAPVRLALREEVAIVTLDRPARLNAIDTGLAHALDAALDAAARSGARALMLAGAGRAFCAGGDLDAFDGAVAHADRAREIIDALHPAILKLARLEIPTVAAAHGAVAGAGLSLLLACDLALAADDARFTLAYPKIGATLDGGASWFLPRLLGMRRAKELALLSERFDAREALALGLVNRVYPAAEFSALSLAFARDLAGRATGALGAIRRLLEDAPSRSLADHLDAEREAFARAAAGPEFAEGRAAFLGKRAPVFPRG